MILLLLACHTEPSPQAEVVFVRGGTLLLSAGQAPTFTAGPWTPGQTVQVGALSAIAPAKAECVPVVSVDLGDVSRLIAMGGGAPDTALEWSPDGRWLAVGSYRGEVLILDGWTGAVRARRSLSESLVKTLAWAPDGATLYVGEQSPDAMLLALSPDSLETIWKMRLADRVGSSPAPAGEDLFLVYDLPGVYTLEVLPGGDLLVGAAHGWNHDDGTRSNLSQILRVKPDGTVAATWPEQPLDATMLHIAVDGPGGVMAISMSRTASGPAPEGYAINGIQLLDLATFTPMASVTHPPLGPHFKTTFLWENLDVSRAADALLTGYGDGRVIVSGLDGRERTALTTGAPVMAGDVPISSGANFGLLYQDQALFLTTSTQIPWGAAAPELRPPSTHPAEHTVWAWGFDGKARWTWHGAQAMEGLSRAGDTLAVAVGPREGEARHDLYGALIFDLSGEGRSGEERLQAWCPTEGPVFFRPSLAADGRVALAEHPYVGADEKLHGAYRVTVLR